MCRLQVVLKYLHYNSKFNNFISTYQKKGKEAYLVKSLKTYVLQI